ncbi:MAG: hypothetical protein ACOYVJ_12390 [Nitrospirota bacterium]
MRNHGKRNKLLCCFLALLSLLALSACTTATVRNTWTDDSYAGGTLDNILLIGIMEPQYARRFFEDEFASRLRARGIRTVSSYTLLTEESKENEETMLSEEALKEKIRELSIDIVLLARFVDIVDIAGYETYPTNVTSPRLADYYGFCCQNLVTGGYGVKFETKIFQAKDDRLIWSAESEMIFERTSRFMVRSVIDAFLTDLTAARLVPSAP